MLHLPRLPSLFALAAILATALFWACGTAAPCGPESCFGCCDATGICVVPSNDACGAAGAVCSACSGDETCETGVCKSTGTTVFDAGTTMTKTDAGVVSCRTGLVSCGGRCSDTARDNDHCGQCETKCFTSAGELCSDGSCIELGACSGPGVCPAGAYCKSGTCALGCENTAGCPSGASCNTSSRECVCPSNSHVCGNTCVANDDITACGASCVKCQTDPNAVTVCASGACKLTCNTGFHRCGNTCVSDTAVTSCGASCSPCPVPANATATCDGNACGHYCNVGYRSCASGCCAWNFQKVSQSTRYSDTVAMALDGQGVPHIVHGSSGSGYINYARRVSSGFVEESVLPEGIFAGRHMAIDVESGGTPHLAFGVYGSTANRLFYATKTGSAFVNQDAGYLTAPADTRGSALGIVVDGAGEPTIFALNSTPAEVRRSGGSWTWAYVNEDFGTLSPLGVARDSAGTLHLAWNSDDGLRYARKPSGGTWASEDVVTTGSRDGIAFALRGTTPHIAFYDTGLGRIRHAVKGSSSWTVTDFVPLIGRHLSLAVDSAGALHLAFRRGSTNELIYVKKAGATLEVSSLGKRTDGKQLVLRLDGSGNPRIAYIDETGSAQYAY